MRDETDANAKEKREEKDNVHGQIHFEFADCNRSRDACPKDFGCTCLCVCVCVYVCMRMIIR